MRRAARRLQLIESPVQAAPVTEAPQCPTCWGQRAIWEPGPLGLIPVACADCGATGYAA